MATFLKGAVKVFIARANETNDTYAATDGPNASTLAKNATELWDGDANREYFLVPGVTGVSIGGFGKEFDTFQRLDDAFDHEIEIKETGSGSCDFIMEYNRTAGNTGISHEHLKALAYYWPNGWNAVKAGSGGNYAVWDATLDAPLATGASATTGFNGRVDHYRGYNILIEQKTGDGTNSIYWCFHNCKISCSISFASKQASRGSFSWEDARYVTWDESTDDGITSGTTAYSETTAKGF